MQDKLIFHITHVQNLLGIIEAGCLWSDAKCRELGIGPTNIGYSHIKDRRMRRPIRVGMEGTLGQYVPFNFCPRSVMLYVIHQKHADFNEGQNEIVHLVSTIQTVVTSGREWVFTDIHADLDYARHFHDLSELDQVDWSVMPLQLWRGEETKRKRQAEFLIWDWAPWECVTHIGVKTNDVALKVQAMLAAANHKPQVRIKPNWYYY
ncbi:MAG TPA: DUF4433 domain-containing protein [Burkholderiales bacterium]|jgi:hypothetical protein|nr:DUF4433 domain-containing protein [Burkholderiales bacterium]